MQQLDDEFIDRFAVAGSADDVHDRLAELAACGLDRVIVVPCSVDTARDTLWRANERFAREALPELVEA